MGAVAIHRLTDWPVFRHVAPVLEYLGVEREALTGWHYFYAKDAVSFPFANLPKSTRFADHGEALRAVGSALADTGRGLVGAKPGVAMVAGFHTSAALEDLERAVATAGHDVVQVDPVARTEEPPGHLVSLFEKWEADDVRALLAGLPKAVARSALEYLDRGGALPALQPPPGKEAALRYHFDFSHWTERHERLLDVFVALSDQRGCPTWAPQGLSGSALADAAGTLRDKLLARGVPEHLLLEKLCEPARPGSSQRSYGHTGWPSSAFLLTSWLARLDEVAALGPARWEALLHAQRDHPAGLRVLAGLAVDRWCRGGGFTKLDLAGLEACALVDAHAGGPALRAEAARLHRERVLGGGDASLRQLVWVMQDARFGVPLDAADTDRFQSALEGVEARVDSTLEDWRLARDLEIVDDTLFARGVVAPFRRAVAAGFRAGPHGFGDQEGFMACAPMVAAADPDLCLRGWLALTARFNENGLRLHVDAWGKVVPKAGFSSAALAEASSHVSHPSRRSEAKILKRFLDARGIAVTSSPPPELATVDATFEVGTDVAHLLIGSFDAVEAVSAQEDPDEWAPAVKKHKCVGLETGGDGSYAVRVVGSSAGVAPASRVDAGRHVGTFPLVIKGDTLTVSGIVGAGGTPTIAFPSGTYAADVFSVETGVVVVVTPVTKAPPWGFKKGLPQLG